MAKTDPDKQKEVTAQSFRRIAKKLRLRARDYRSLNPLYAPVVLAFKDMAIIFDAEATLLRKMR